MSLLLDALKKAAQDKQNSASNTAGATPSKKPADELELTLDLEALPASARAAELTTSSDTQADEPALQIDDAPSHPVMADELPILAADITPPPAEIRYEAAVVPKPKPQAPTAQPTPPPAETKKPPQPSASSRSATSSAAVLAAQEAAAKQRDALDMMINKSRQSNDQNRNIQLYGLIIFCLLLLILGGIYFYASSEPTPPVAEQPPIANEAATIVEPIEEVEAVQLAAPVAQPAPKQHASSNIPPPRRAVATASKAAAAKPAAEPLQFSRTTRPDPIELLLAQAYEKFQAADYAGANELYTQVLLREADSRDGLLGAAAVAMKQQRFDYARQKYQQLLMLDPKDSIARAGISTIDMDVRDESKLKFMLREQPESPHLYFALGALYASQTRWADAQQAYFSALSGDNTNADYAYNLAVSLDRLGQYKAASSHYQKALQLAEARRGGFVTSDLQARIEQIARLPDAPR